MLLSDEHGIRNYGNAVPTIGYLKIRLVFNKVIDNLVHNFSVSWWIQSALVNMKNDDFITSWMLH